MSGWRRSNFDWGQRAAIVVAGLLLCGAGVESRSFRAPPDATAYRARVSAARRALGLDIGDWRGEDQKVQVEAMKLLRPSFIISRGYRNMKNGEGVSLLVVDCQDARDTISHYPPVCYVGAGYSLEGSEVRDWKLPHMTIHGTEYTFLSSALESNNNLVVDDFFVMPGLGTAPERNAVIAAAKDMQRRFYGVGQVQLVFDARTNVQERERVFTEVVGGMENLIQAIETINVRDASETGAAPPIKVSHE